MLSDRDLLVVLRDIRRRLDTNLSLDAIATSAGWSRFHLHRAFRRLVGETPKQYTLRLRLERAAAHLITSDDSVLDVALAAGFAGHEVFARAFRRQFGRSPVRYRSETWARVPRAAKERHAAITDAVGPCVGLYGLALDASSRRDPMSTPPISRQELRAQPALFIRRRIARHELQATLAECLRKIYGYCHRVGIPLSGRPLTRYVSTGPGLWIIEAGKPLVTAVAGEGEIEPGFLAGGPVAMAVHMGPYDRLSETYAAIERWIEANGFRTGGAPWESYITDPADDPDPSHWRTDVYWPLAA